jgi:hypothetical protein
MNLIQTFPLKLSWYFYGPWLNPREGVALLGRRKNEAGKKNICSSSCIATKKEKESRVKLKTEQIEKTLTRKTEEEKIKKIANSEA